MTNFMSALTDLNNTVDNFSVVTMSQLVISIKIPAAAEKQKSVKYFIIVPYLECNPLCELSFKGKIKHCAIIHYQTKL